MRAQVKFFKSSKGYGFVKCPQGGTDFFFHIHDYCGGNSRKHAARMLKPEKMRFQVKGETAQQYIWNQHINVVVDIEQGKPRVTSWNLIEKEPARRLGIKRFGGCART